MAIEVDSDTGETFVMTLAGDEDEDGESAATQLIQTMDEPLWKACPNSNF